MQTVDEQVELSRHVMATAELIGAVMTSTMVSLIVGDLEKYPFLACIDALKRCRADLSGKLTLKNITERIEDGHLERNEAWGLALQSTNESATVVWTKEIQTAYEAAKPILGSGDRVGARMAFMEAYDRLLASARATGKPSQWSVSIGWDAEARDQALESAVNLQRLTMDRAEALGYKAAPALTADGKALAALLTGPDKRMLALTSDEKTRNALLSESSSGEGPSTEFKTRLHQLRQDLQKANDDRQKRARNLSMARLRDLEQRKSHVAATVQSMMSTSQ